MTKQVMLHVYDDTRGNAECRSCHAPITWFQLVSGKKHPFERDPVFLATAHGDDRRLIGAIGSEDSHFAHCPDAKEWSRK